MKSLLAISAAGWLRGATALVLLTLFLVPGCSDDRAPTAPDATFMQVNDTVSLGLAPEFCPNLPTYPIVAWHGYGGSGRFSIGFWGIGSGYDVEDLSVNGTRYPGWCIENYPLPNVSDPDRVTMYCSYDDALPGNLSDLPLNELNYLLNHKAGTADEVQVAIWLLLGWETPSEPVTEAAIAMKDDALANGGDFIPGWGDIVGIILYTGDGGIGPEGFQETIFELLIPGVEGDACTPGYWKTHFDRWPDGYSHLDDFDTTFGTDYFSRDITLGQATWAQGGGVKKLARHGVAALLNAAHMGVEYPYTVAEVIDMVRAGDADTLADTNDWLECPLEGSSADPTPQLGF